ncbi:MAG: hypothetical protein U9Q81_23880, partial [Pseudomonadota bacterium]|nr:hypothetical protein [Pseudomonadota bacterium]
MHRRLTAIALALGGSFAVLWTGHWWVTLPRTPEELFRARCSSCHELRTTRVCEFAAELRPAIVDTMRQLHGADEVIDDEEAVVIGRYLEESLICP